jgi:hypothetical protein
VKRITGSGAGALPGMGLDGTLLQELAKSGRQMNAITIALNEHAAALRENSKLQQETNELLRVLVKGMGQASAVVALAENAVRDDIAARNKVGA